MSESVFVPPAGVAATGYVTTGHERHGNHDGHRGDHDWPSRTSERVKDELSRNASERGEQTRDILEAICSSNGAAIAAVNVQGSANAIATEKTGAAGILATSVASGAIGVAIERTSAAGQLATNVAGQQVQNLALSQFNLLQVQAQTNAAALNLEAVKNAGATALASATTTAAVLAKMAELAAISDAKAAECCCALKELVRAQGEEGRLLQLKIQADNQASALNDAKMEILALKVKPVTTITAI